MSFKEEYADYLMHYGVKGMKWKDHKYAEIVKVGEKTRSADYKATKEKTKKVAELQSRINRTQNTIPSALKRGMVLKSINKDGTLALESAKKGYGNALQGESTVKRNEVSSQDKKKGMKYDADSNKMVSATKGSGNQFQGESTVKRNEDPNAYKKNLEAAKKKEASKVRSQSKIEKFAAEAEKENTSFKSKTVKEAKENNIVKKVLNFIKNLFK